MVLQHIWKHSDQYTSTCTRCGMRRVRARYGPYLKQWSKTYTAADGKWIGMRLTAPKCVPGKTGGA